MPPPWEVCLRRSPEVAHAQLVLELFDEDCPAPASVSSRRVRKGALDGARPG